MGNYDAMQMEMVEKYSLSVECTTSKLPLLSGSILAVYQGKVLYMKE
jgi:hypothetical protein